MNYKAIHEIKPKNQKATKMFQNPILEALTVSHAAVPISMLVLFGISFLYWGTQHTALTKQQYVLLVFSGMFFWTLFEYLAHKHLYHMLPTNKVKGWIQYNFHGVHHEYPKDKRKIAMPPIVITVASFMFLFLFRAVLGDFTFGFTPGFLFGYATYLCVHFSVHVFQPPKNIFRVLWVNHGIHHYKDPDVAFGVSSPLWDFVFGSLPKKKSS